MRIEIKTDGGKYTYQFTDDGKTQILRYGKEWRNETGDGALLSLMQYAESLEAKIKEAKEGLSTLKVAVNDLVNDPGATRFVQGMINKLEAE